MPGQELIMERHPSTEETASHTIRLWVPYTQRGQIAPLHCDFGEQVLQALERMKHHHNQQAKGVSRCRV